MTTHRHTDHPKWGCCGGGYHESFEEAADLSDEVDILALTDDQLRILVSEQNELPSHDLCREELLCLLSRRPARGDARRAKLL